MNYATVRSIDYYNKRRSNGLIVFLFMSIILIFVKESIELNNFNLKSMTYILHEN